MEMSSPAKKRKTNDYKASPKTVRSLDYFFGKQKKESATVEDEKNHCNNLGSSPKQVDEKELTDEQLARKLQAQWDEEDHAALVATPSQLTSTFPKNERTTREGSVEDEGSTLDENSTSKGATANEAIKEARPQEFAKNTLSLQSVSAKEDTISTSIPFDESPLTFDPDKYIPDLKEQWVGEGGTATYALLIRCFVLVNSTQSRIKIVDTLVNLLRTIILSDPESLLPAVRVSVPWKDLH